jgi:2,4-dienoyl-CoA reductase (NADPH2)
MATPEALADFDDIIIATGAPRDPQIPGQMAQMYCPIDVLRRKAAVGKRVVIIGAGGIGLMWQSSL